jgi:hypothetical protein
LDRTHNGGIDAFVIKLNGRGSTLAYSTYLGGSGEDGGFSVVVDKGNNVYLAGETDSSDFPVTRGAFDTTHNGGFDAVVAKLNARGTALIYSTYLGGSGEDTFPWITIDRDGNAYVTGSTDSHDYPTTQGAFDRSHNGSVDAFVTKLNAKGSALIYSTYLGGAADDFGLGITVDKRGNVYVIGETDSADFPTTRGAFERTHNGGFDAYVMKLRTKTLYNAVDHILTRMAKEQRPFRFGSQHRFELDVDLLANSSLE